MSFCGLGGTQTVALIGEVPKMGWDEALAKTSRDHLLEVATLVTQVSLFAVTQPNTAASVQALSVISLDFT